MHRTDLWVPLKLQSVLTLCLTCFMIFSQQIGSASGKSYIEDLTLTAKEKEQLDKFRELMSPKVPHDYMKEDVYLIRWLRAGYFDIQQSERKLMDNLRWREQQSMDTIHDEDWSDLSHSYKYSLKPRSRDGKITLYVHFGRWDLRKASISGKTERFYRYIDKIIDEAYILVRSEGERLQNVSQGILMLNIDGFNLVEHGCLQCVPVILGIISTYEKHFFNIADKWLVLNGPGIALPILSLARRAIHPITNRDLYFYGTNKNMWQEVLARDYTLDQIPEDLGGTLRLDSDSDLDDHRDESEDDFNLRRRFKEYS